MRGVIMLAAVAGCSGRTAPPGVETSEVAQVPMAAHAVGGTSSGPLEPDPPEARQHAVVECPVVPQVADRDAAATILVDAANQQVERGNYAAAWTCADRAADLMPGSVEAHHLRAVALAELGRRDEAQIAYALALTLDPEDAETLRAVANFYINGLRKTARIRDALNLGLAYAQRGSRRLIATRRRNPQLAANLAILEAQALNDLGRSQEALPRLDAVLRLAPERGDALHEKAVALFDLSRFAEAKALLVRALAIQPEDAFSHHMLGLTLEQLGDHVTAQRELARARELAPTELFEPVEISEQEFQAEVDTVVASLSADRKARLRSVQIELTDLPDPTDLSAVDPPFPPTILGLYRGPLGKTWAGAAHGETPSIVLYRRNLARAVKTRAELSQQIKDTLLHEIGHLEGLDEDDLRRRGME